MKKFLPLFILITGILILAGCSDPKDGTENQIEEKTDEKQTSEKTDEKTSDEETSDEKITSLEGSYFDSSSNERLVFDSTTMTVYNSSTTGDSRAAISDTKSAVYNYTLDEEAKTITVQLQSLWDTNQIAITYNSKILEIKATYQALKTQVLAQLETATSSLVTQLNQVQSGYGDQVLTLIKDKLTAYLEKQGKLLENYLEKKYKANIIFEYDISDGLKLTQIYQDDLTDASAHFYADGIGINDYENLKPFTITVDSVEYVGVPEIKDGNLAVDLTPYQTDAESAMTYYAKLITDISTSFVTLLTSMPDTETLGKLIDEKLAASALSATVLVTATDKTAPTVTLSNVNCTSAPVVSNKSYNLSYKSILACNKNVLNKQ